jgi:hypothetical protein
MPNPNSGTPGGSLASDALWPEPVVAPETLRSTDAECGGPFVSDSKFPQASSGMPRMRSAGTVFHAPC